MNRAIALLALVLSLPILAQEVTFHAVPETIAVGQSATLSWTTTANGVTIDNGVGNRGPRGTATVTPTQTTTYRLTAGGATATATVRVVTAPSVLVTRYPTGMVMTPDGSASDYYVVSNLGGAAAQVTSSRSGEFFRQSPESFSLAPGASQRVNITSATTATGAYAGNAVIIATGLTDPIFVPVRLGVVALSPGAVAVPAERRVDVRNLGDGGDDEHGPNLGGEARFTNTGTGPLTATVSTDSPWLEPSETNVITIPPGGTVVIPFKVDRTKRGEGADNSPVGSSDATLSVNYLTAPTTPTTSTVTVVDTVPPAVGTGAIPALNAGQVALLIPGVGHVQGSVGVFASDLTLLHRGNRSASNSVTMYYTPSGGAGATQLTQIPNLSRSSNVRLADFVRSVFGANAQIGTLQIRATSIEDIAAGAVVMNVTNPRGTYGSTIPVFRTDRAVAVGDSMFLSGLRSGDGMHTNVYLQEAAGAQTVVRTDFLDEVGNVVSSRTDNVAPFALAQLGPAVPEGAVAARMTHGDGSQGRFVAFATPVDRASGDTWTVIDWARYYGLSANDEKVIPVAGTVHGANETFFRTDLAVQNPTNQNATATLRFTASNGTNIDRTVEMPPNHSRLFFDSVVTLFNTPTDAVGFLKVIGPLSVNSRTYTTSATSNGTFGTAVPALGPRSSIRLGEVMRLSGIEDSASATVSAARPATYRTNLGLVETAGASATVRLTIRFRFPAGTRVDAAGQASLDVDMQPNQFVQLNPLTTRVLQSARDQFGDLRDVELTVQVTGGDGAVAVFTSSIDNATGDSVLRTE